MIMLPSHDLSRQCSGQAQWEKLPNGLFLLDSTDIFLLLWKKYKKINEKCMNSYIIINESLGTNIVNKHTLEGYEK
jgi:hypothetical protein